MLCMLNELPFCIHNEDKGGTKERRREKFTWYGKLLVERMVVTPAVGC
jgi:hypothetical protein